MIMVSDVSFSYDSKPVFSRVSLSFGAGWTALVGANGSGKSTLIKLIAGVLKPDRGSVSAPDVAVCPQDLDRPPDCFTDADILNNPEFFALLARLNITADWLERWDTLSGGEKKRCVIADALIRKPDALILDEPANHIDGETTALLAGALSRFEGAGIIVSHNMGFLDSLCTNTVILDPWEEGSRAVSIAANPVAALAEWDRKQDFLRGRKAALAEQAQKLDRAQKDAVRAAEQDKKAKLSKSALDPHDSAGRAKINLAVLSGRDRTGGKKAAALETALNRTRSDLDAVSVKGLRKTGAGLRGERLERPVLLALPEGAAVVAEGAVRIVHPAIEIRNDSRIVLSGNNGSGKTSLVEYILSALRLPARAVWRLKQELSWEDRAAALERFRALNNADRGAALSVVYRLGSEPDALLSTRSLSPGEARKLLFAFAMLEGASLVILDEPTNHLDAIAAAALADALNEFEGAALIVTHDRFFAAKTGKTFWRLDRTADGAKLEIADQA